MSLPKQATTTRARALAAGFAASLMLAGAAQAQLCFDVFSASDDPLLQCADTDYFFDSIEPGFDPDSFAGSRTGTQSASFDGFDLFDEPELDPPSSLFEPFFSNTQFSATGGFARATSLIAEHRGSVSMGARDSEFQSAAYQTRSRITFQAINQSEPGMPLSLNLSLNFTLTLADPMANSTTGAALGGFGIKFIGGDDDPFQDPLFDVSALVELDLDQGETEPVFFGFDDPELDGGIVGIDFAPAAPDIEDIFDIEIDIDLDLDIDVEPGEDIVLELDTFGSIFTDGFESGDVAAWTASSPDTFTFTVNANDPNVRFVIAVPEPSGSALVVLAGSLLIARRRRR